MRRTLMLLLPVAVLAVLVGCAGSPQPLAVTNDAKVEPQAGDTIEERSEDFESSIDDGKSIFSDITAPMEPRYKSRTPGELTQVSFTRVGGDNSVDTSPVEDLVVFSSDRHSLDHNIYIKAPSGKTVTQKTFGPFDEIQPSFSPDGKRIAFACNKNGNYDIWIVETHANGTEVQVTFGDEDELHPSWTPDGQSIIYSAYSSRLGEWNIMLTDLRTGEVRDLGRGKFPEVSPDGTKIVFQRARQRDGCWYSIWVMNLDGTNQTEIVSSADWAAINPCWSPDGRFIAFATVYKSPQAKIEDRIWRGDDIFIVGVNGRGLLQMTADPQPAWDPCWSSRDGRVYFVSERNGFRNIWSKKPPVFSVASKPASPESTATP